ncbi:hypothetical protein BLGI_3608 [Brevibacillus laterosporus GI-9]|nr:hypothetical protein BLGI_3608 [Brevibacillus laterosporus GI-9]
MNFRKAKRGLLHKGKLASFSCNLKVISVVLFPFYFFNNSLAVY